MCADTLLKILHHLLFIGVGHGQVGPTLDSLPGLRGHPEPQDVVLAIPKGRGRIRFQMLQLCPPHWGGGGQEHLVDEC